MVRRDQDVRLVLTTDDPHRSRRPGVFVIRFVDELPQPVVPVQVDELTVPVLPLAHVLRAHAVLAELLDRSECRLAAEGGRRTV